MNSYLLSNKSLFLTFMIRDGVSESQFDKVLNVELNQIIKVCVLIFTYLFCVLFFLKRVF